MRMMRPMRLTDIQIESYLVCENHYHHFFILLDPFLVQLQLFPY